MKVKAILITILLSMACNVFANGASQNTGGLTLREGVLTIGMEIGYPPMEYYDSDGRTPIGFDVSMAKAIAEKLGLKLEIIDVSWDGIFAGVETGKYDCIVSSVTITPERLVTHNFTRPYISNPLVLVTLKNSPVKPASPQDLNGLGVSYQAETTAKFFMRRLVEREGLNYVPYEYDKIMSSFDELVLGRVDVILTDTMVAMDYIAKPDSPFEIVWQGEVDEAFGICLKKGNDALTAAIDNALAELFSDGTMRRISEEFLNVDMVSAVQKQNANVLQKIISWMPALLTGAQVTIGLTITSVSAGLILSLFLALGKMSKRFAINKFCSAYIFFFRGTPLLMQLYFIYYALPMISPIFIIRTGDQFFDRFIPAFITFALNAAAYCAEIIRAAIQSIDKGQFEASKALGLGYWQTMTLVIIPQAIRRIIPPIGNEFIMVLKDASLVSMIALIDITRATRSIESSTRSALVYLPAMLLYLAITAIFSFIFNKAEKKYSVYE